ncbi:MAG: chemotaxis response regulator protein-glutamate methylesterase [Verrucomicrobiaceae bacterium]|nr:chemotaxis response regulator protein-glutamate methylesterase [Verrucomicrobiaceae bacterium]
MSARPPIQVLVVEDSPAMCELLVHILSADPELLVVGTASNGEQAIEMVKRKKPDVITMDLHMPHMNGIEAVRLIMQSMPTPIVIVSGSSATAETAETFQALEAGALALVEKPSNSDTVKSRQLAAKLVQTVKLMAEVRVVRRWPKRTVNMTAQLAERIASAATVDPQQVQLVAIGASTGGPLVLQKILMGLAGKLSVPVIIVQHMANGFTSGFADWLQQSTQLPVTVAKEGEYMQPGRVYIAPEERHTEIKTGLRIKLSAAEPENGHRPAVAPLFRSAATVLGGGAIGVLLTGMGRDGAIELKLLRDCGATTIAQDLQSSVVPGMPGEAIRLDAAMHVLAPDKIADVLIALTPVHGTNN